MAITTRQQRVQRRNEALKLIADGVPPTDAASQLTVKWGCSRRTSLRDIEIAAEDEIAPENFNSNARDEIVNKDGADYSERLIKSNLKDYIFNESLDHNDNQMLDIHDAEHFIRSAMGTYPGQALTTGCCADPTKLISIEEQLTVIEESQLLA